MVKLGYTREEIMSNLQTQIEKIKQHNETWLESIVEYCQQFDLEETEVLQYLSPVLIDRIKKESLSLHLLKPNKDEVSLPF